MCFDRLLNCTGGGGGGGDVMRRGVPQTNPYAGVGAVQPQGG